MNYSLTLDLIGADKVDSVLQKLSSAQAAVASGATQSTSTSPTQAQAVEIEKVRGVSKKAVQDIGTAAAQGLSATGQAWVNMFSKNGKSQGVFQPSASFLARNPQLAAMFGGGGQNPPTGNNPSGGGSGSSGGGSSATASTFSLVRLYIAARAARFIFEELSKAVKGAVAAYDDARQRYAKSLLSGLGVQATTRRELLASVLGVSEKDVMQFGSAINYLNPKLANAIKVLTETNPVVTKIGFDIAILRTNFKAMGAALASEAAPAIEILINALGSLVRYIQDHAHTILGLIGFNTPTPQENRQALNDSFFQNNRGVAGKAIDSIGLKRGGNESLEGFQQRIIDTFKKFDPKAIAEVLRGSGMDAISARIFSKFIEQNRQPLGDNKGSGIPNPEGHMKQLPASSFERMGLILGGGSGQHYTRDIANHTKSMAEGIKMIVGNMRGSSLPRGFNMDSRTANP